MYETRRQPLIARAAFLRRLAGHVSAALALVAGSLALGVAGYMRLEGLFALYSGLVFIATAALLLGPVVHRLLHRFHLDRD